MVKHEDTTGTRGDGPRALQELVGKYNKVTDEVIRSTMDKGRIPTTSSLAKTLARSELDKMGDPTSDRRLKDICVQGFTAEYKDIKLMMYRDSTFDIDQMQSTMRHLCLDYLSRNNGAKGGIPGRGVAMASETSACSHCATEGHVARKYGKKRGETNKSGGDAGGDHDKKQKGKKYFGKKTGSKAGGAKGASARKWCSVHKTTTHSDEGCYAHGAPLPEPKGAHLASAVLGAASSPADADANPSRNFDYDFDKGFAFSGLTTDSGGGVSVSNPN